MCVCLYVNYGDTLVINPLFSIIIMQLFRYSVLLKFHLLSSFVQYIFKGDLRNIS